MPFRYAFVCDLLEKLHRLHARHPPYLPAHLKQFTVRAVTTWFKKHDYRIKNETNPLILLSILLADKYNDRDYGLTEATLARIVGRTFSLSKAHYDALVLDTWEGKTLDLGQRVELITAQLDSAIHRERVCNITIEEVDQALAPVAFSGRVGNQTSIGPVDATKLSSLLKRLKPRERKWLTRLILKDYAPISMPHELICSLYHELLPGLLMMRFDLKCALDVLAKARAANVALPSTRTTESTPAPELPEPAVETGSSSPVKSSDSGKRRSSPNSELILSSPKRQRVDIFEDDTAHPKATEDSAALTTRKENTSSQNSQVAVEVTRSQSIRRQSQALSDITGRRHSKQPTMPINEGSDLAKKLHDLKTKKNTFIDTEETEDIRLIQRKAETEEKKCELNRRRCTIYRRGIGFLTMNNPAEYQSPLIAKHGLKVITLDDLQHPLKMCKYRKLDQLRLVLVDRRVLDVEAVDAARLSSKGSGRGLTAFVDVYDVRLLDSIERSGVCEDVSEERMKRYWLGVIEMAK